MSSGWIRTSGPATIEIIDDQETILAGGRFGTDRDGYRAMLAWADATRSGSGQPKAATAWAGTSSDRAHSDGDM
ncbi:hypothetical protein Vau01_119130 [Virgisporangium aurantiacum]|uniref:Uncharacterized protein n=1 Tax=Virgisporangium aurantiacum TaxID=175570 RepID=A0A8J3ZHU8_9ACTN|nr:hypothetical protein Vau01_119130 [Virgisporangium aurantiacum]